MMDIVAQTEKDIPKYMRLNTQSQYELGQGIEAALASAERSDLSSQTQACYQLCWQQVLEQLQEEYQLEVPESLSLSNVNDNRSLHTALLKMVVLSGIQWQFKPQQKQSLENFKRDFKSVLARGLLDALDLMNAKGLWYFDIQGDVEQLQKRIFSAVDVYRFSKVAR